MSIITVAREYGSGGRDVAKIVADRLGYDCVDKELIAETAHAAGVSEDVVEQLDEVGESPIRRFLGELFTPSTVYSLSPEYPPLIWPYVPGDDEGTKDPTSLKNTFLDRDEYLQILQDTIRSLADRQHIIIVGRGCQCILAERKDVFHTLFVAPFEYRVDVIMDEMNLIAGPGRRTHQGKGPAAVAVPAAQLPSRLDGPDAVPRGIQHVPDVVGEHGRHRDRLPPQTLRRRRMKA